MSVCLSVRFRWKRDFLGPYIRWSSHFLCTHSSCIWASILQILCPSFCRSGYKRQKSFATYGCRHPCFLFYLEYIAKILGEYGWRESLFDLVVDGNTFIHAWTSQNVDNWGKGLSKKDEKIHIKALFKSLINVSEALESV